MSQHGRLTILVAAVAGFSFLGWLGSTRLWDDDEPKNAVCGQEMFERGDWIVPTFNGTLRTDKPILIYWCMLAAFNVLGVNELAIRLPSALAGIGTVVLTFHLGRLLFDRRTGLVASGLLTSALMFAVLARAATPDSLLIVWITASLTSFVAGVAARRGGHFGGDSANSRGTVVPICEHGLPTTAWLLMYASIGIAVLAKGPIGVVMPLGIIGSYLLFFDSPPNQAANTNWLRRCLSYFAPRRIWTIANTLHVFTGAAIVALIALPWYIAVAVQTHGEWVTGFLGTHNIGRFMQPLEHHRGLPIYYPIAIMIGFFPASMFLPVALWSSIHTVRQDTSGRRSSAAFLLCWIACYVGFFTVAATKLPNYVVPCYPALAIVTAAWLILITDRGTAMRTWHLWTGYGASAILGLGITAGLTIAAYKILDIHNFVALPGIIMIVGSLTCLTMLYQNRVSRSVLSFVLTCLLFTASATIHTGMQVNDAQDGPYFARYIHEHIHATSPDAPKIGTYAYFPPSLVYYLGYPVHRPTGPQQLQAFFAEGGDAIVMTRATFEKQRASLPSDITILTHQQRFLRTDQDIVLVGRPTEVAEGDRRGQQR